MAGVRDIAESEEDGGDPTVDHPADIADIGVTAWNRRDPDSDIRIARRPAFQSKKPGFTVPDLP